MIGTVYVMEPEQYDAWLTGGGAQGSLSQKGEALFQQLGCATCHQSEANRQGRCPNLSGVYGQPVRTDAGSGDKPTPAYIRESILNPSAKIVAGYQNIMPAFAGLVTEEGLQQLIEYIKSLGPATGANGAPVAASPGAAAAAVTSGSQPGSRCATERRIPIPGWRRKTGRN